VIDRLFCLRHDTVIGSNNKDYNISDFCTASPHCSKSFMTRSVEESNLPAVQFNIICADMLGYAACFTGDDICLANCIKQRCFSMVNVAHDGYYR